MKHEITYSEPYPTIGDLIKNKSYDYVEYRLIIPETSGQRTLFAGCFEVIDGHIKTFDGDNYLESDEVCMSAEWSDTDHNIKKGLTIVVASIDM